MRSRAFFISAAALSALAACLAAVPLSFSADQGAAPELSIIYPKHQSLVGRRVNVVLDPSTDWSRIGSFQVVVGNTEYPAVDPSSGRHAYQGIPLAPGMNTITVRALASAPAATTSGSSKGKDGETGRMTVVASRTLAVYNGEENFTQAPSSFAPRYFHTRDNESPCSGCHRLEVEKQDREHAKPDQVLCNACHREIPVGRHIHGPAAVWSCLSCHDPELFPVKYQFNSVDPWKLTKTISPAEPPVFTVPAGALFKPLTATLLSDDVPRVTVVKGKKRDRKKEQELIRRRDEEVRKRKQQQRELFQPFLDYAKQNPNDKIRIEAHVDQTVVTRTTGTGKKATGYRDNAQLTAARAQAIARVLKEYGLTGKNRVFSAGMGSSLPKVPSMTSGEKELNNRIEIVVYPQGAKVVNSQNLTALKDRDRVVINLAYAQGAAEVKGIRVVEKLPKGLAYVGASSSFHGQVRDPKSRSGELVWDLGDLGAYFQESLTYVVRKEPGTKAVVSPVQEVRFLAGKNEQTRVFDPQKPVKNGLSVMETCQKCHDDMLAGVYKHGPTAAGYCTLCHDPHASNYPKWTRRQSWQLCTTCHAEKGSEPHLVRGIVLNVSHPTRSYRDPIRYGKQLACVSCHSPHSADTAELLAYNARSGFDLCKKCHPKK